MAGISFLGFNDAMERREKVLEVCMQNGWKFVCMQPGKRFVIQVGQHKYYWTFKEVLEKGSELNGKTNSLDNLQVGGNSLLAGGVSNKVSLVRYPGGI